MIEAVVAPLFHRYVPVPDTETVLLCPAQMVAGEAFAVILGGFISNTVVVAVLVHPFTPVTVTVYVVLAALGVTEIEALVSPVLHKYVPPPVAVRVLLKPSQTVFGEALAVAFGCGFTVTVVVAVLVQPPGPVTVTV